MKSDILLYVIAFVCWTVLASAFGYEAGRQSSSTAVFHGEVVPGVYCLTITSNNQAALNCWEGK